LPMLSLLYSQPRDFLRLILARTTR
jgi:hypothetical protein